MISKENKPEAMRGNDNPDRKSYGIFKSGSLKGNRLDPNF